MWITEGDHAKGSAQPNGADPNIEDKNGYIAMDYLCRDGYCGYDDVCEILRYYNSRESNSISHFSWYYDPFENSEEDSGEDSGEEPIYNNWEDSGEDSDF